MKPVRTQQRYKCDFCKRKSAKTSMIAHEKICFRNPNRFCELCQNKGSYTEVHGDLIEEGDGGLSEEIECIYCSKFDKKMLKEIEKREKSEVVEEKKPQEVPF